VDWTSSGAVRGAIYPLAAGVATAASWLAWFGWHRAKTLGPDGYLHGPYESWQVAGFVLILGAIAAVLGWVGQVFSGVAVVTVVTTLAFSSDALADTKNNDGLWLVGAILVAVGTFCWVCAIGAVSRSVRRRLRPNSQCSAPSPEVD
jgi:hypothetical protein